MIIEREQRLYDRMNRTLRMYQRDSLPMDLVLERENRYRNQFKGYLQSMNDLELITSQEYVDYFNVYCSNIDKMMGRN